MLCKSGRRERRPKNERAKVGFVVDSEGSEKYYIVCVCMYIAKEDILLCKNDSDASALL